jgi:ankyrin repeat protein
LTALQLQQPKNPPIQESSNNPSPHALTSLRSPHSADDTSVEHIAHTPAATLNAQEVPTFYDEEGKPMLDWDWNICPCCHQSFGGIQCTQNGCIDTSWLRDENQTSNTRLIATETDIFAELDGGILSYDRLPNQKPTIESKPPMPIIEALSTPISFLQHTTTENNEGHYSQLLCDDSHNTSLKTITDSPSPSQRESRASDSCNSAPLQFHEVQQEIPETRGQGSVANQVAAFVPGERYSACSLIPSIMSLGRRLNKQNRDSITSSLVRHTHAVMRGALRPAAFVGLSSSSRMSLIRSAAPSFFTEDSKTVQQKTTQQRWAELKGLDWPVCDAISLSRRPCCSLDLRNFEHRRCETCGFSVALEDARRCVKNSSQKSIKEVDTFGNGVLHHAAAAGRASFSFLEYLINCGADINAKNTSRETFMHTLHPQGLGGFANYLKLLRLVDQNSFDLQCTDRYGQTLSHILLREFDVSKISIDEIEEAFDLLRPDIEAADNLGRTIEDYLKHWISAVELHIGSIRTIFESNTKRKARLEMLRSKFKLSWDKKLWIHHPEEFLNTGNVTGNDVDSWLLSMQMSGCDKKIDPRSGSNAIVTMLRQRSDTPVPILVKAVLKLLDNGLEIDHQDREGFTALTHASCLGIRPVVEALLERGANPNIRAYNNMSLLDQVNWTLDQALRKKLDSLYASIMSCTGPLLEGGALSDPTSFDTWRWRQPARLQNKMVEPKPRMKTSSPPSFKQISDPSPQHPIFQGDSVDSSQVMDEQLPLLEGFEEFQSYFNAYNLTGNETVG